MVRLLVSEEYAYRHWLVVYPGTPAQLLEDWLSGRWRLRDSGAADLGRDCDTEVVEHDAFAHAHMDSDSYLEINGELYGFHTEYQYADLCICQTPHPRRPCTAWAKRT